MAPALRPSDICNSGFIGPDGDLVDLVRKGERTLESLEFSYTDIGDATQKSYSASRVLSATLFASAVY